MANEENKLTSNLPQEVPEELLEEMQEAASPEKESTEEAKHLCQCCGEVEIPEDWTYCDKCLNYMRHYPFDAWDVAYPVIAVMFLALSIVLLVLGWSTYHSAAKADAYARADRLTSSISAYADTNTLLSDKDQTPGWIYLKRQLKVYNALGVQSFTDTSDFIGTNYTTADLKKPWNRYAKKMNEEIAGYTAAYNAFSTAASSDDVSDLASFLTAYEEDLKGQTYVEAYANYFRYYACLVYDEDTATQKKYVDAIAADGTKYASLYLPLYSEISLNDKDYDKALSYSAELLKLNQEDSYAYVYRAIAYRMQGNLPKAYNAIQTGLKSNDQNSALNYQMAIYCVLDGDLTKAASYVETAYTYADTVNSYLSAGSLYALIAKERDQTELYDQIVEDLSNYGYTISGDVDSILSGETTFEDIFLSGEGDFTW